MSQTKAQLISDLVQALNFAGTASSPANGLFLSATNTLQLSTASTPRLTINSDGHVDVVGNLDVGAGLDVTGAITTTGGITLNSSGPRITFTDSNENPDFYIEVNATQFLIQDATNDAQRFRIQSNGVVDIAGNTNFSAGIDVVGAITGTAGLSIEGATTFNENGADVDFRVESDANTHALFVNAGNSRVGINTAAPNDELEVTGNVQVTSGILKVTSSNPGVRFTDSDASGGFGHVGVNNTSGSLVLRSDDGNALSGTFMGFEIDGQPKMHLDVDGRFLIGATSSVSTTAMLQTKRANNNTILISNSDATVTNFTAVDFAPANNTIGSRIVSKAIGTFGSSSSETADLFFETKHEGTSAKRMYIDSTGLVGIGTDSPTVTLDIESNAPTIKLTDSDATGTPECEVSGAGGDLVLSADKDGEKDSTKILFKIDGNTDLQIDHDARVVVGAVMTSDTGTYYDDITINNGNTASGAAGGAGLSLVTGASSFGGIIFSTASSHGRGYVKYDQANDRLVFGTQTVDRLMIEDSTNNGDVHVKTGNIVIDSSGRGIDFSAGADGASTSNLLDEYEEGEYTPAVSSGQTLHGSYDRLRYTRVGRKVSITGQLVFNAYNSSSFDTSFTVGLPFNNGDGNDRSEYVFQSGIGYFNPSGTSSPSSGYQHIGFYIAASSSNALIIAANPNSDSTIGNWVGSGSDLWVNLTYFTD